MNMRFNTPPNWPVPPGWTPGPNCQPDPTWPPPPPGWTWWVPEAATATAQAAAPPPPPPGVGLSDNLVAQATDCMRAAQDADRAGDTARARTSARGAEQMLRQAINADPANVEYQLSLARALEVTSEIEVDKDLRRAAATAEEAVRLRLVLVDADPTNAQYLLALGVAYNNLGTVALAHRDGNEAIRWMQVSCQVFQDVLRIQPSSVDAQQHLGAAAFRLGKIAAASDQNTLARAAFEQSVTARQQQAMSPQDHQAWNELGESLTGLGEAQNDLADDSAAAQTGREAVSAFRNAIAHQSDEQGYRTLALALVKSAAMAANVNDAVVSAQCALEAADIWQRYGTQKSRRRWPLVAELLTKAVPAVQGRDPQLADACRRAAANMS